MATSGLRQPEKAEGDDGCHYKRKGEGGPDVAGGVDGLVYKLKIMSYFVYIIRSIKCPQTFYVGYTTNIKKRLATHNSGGSIHKLVDSVSTI